MTAINRRNFLKAMGLTGTTAVMSCSSDPVRKLIPYIIPPEDIVPGKATWYATTCRECPAGCGYLAKNREGRVIKVEGNPLHPVNKGKLCARGQAALQGLYNPDRLKGPLKKSPKGQFEPITWQQAEGFLIQKLKKITAEGRSDHIVFLTALVTGTLRRLEHRWLTELGSSGYVQYEPFAYESLRKANQIVFGNYTIPCYHLAQADFLISFGADFLETWLSPVQHAREFASFHAPSKNGKNLFIYVGSRLSLTAANADHFICVPPGGEFLVALGILRVLLKVNFPLALNPTQKEYLMSIVRDWPLEAVEAKTGIKKQVLNTLAQKFIQARTPLALAGSLSDSRPTETAVAANLLCIIKQDTQKTMDFTNTSALADVAIAHEIKNLSERLRHGDVDLLFIHQANPLFSLPSAWDFGQSMQAVPLVVSFSSIMDETTELAHLVLPTHTPLESWGDYTPSTRVLGMLQPVMGPIFNTRHLGDILIDAGKKISGTKAFPWKNFFHLLRKSLEKNYSDQTATEDFESHWRQSLERGGIWDNSDTRAAGTSAKLLRFSFPHPAAFEPPSQGLHVMAYPTIQFFDGRGASRPWLQELPDPMTKVCWGGWVEINPKTAQRLAIQRGDLLRLRSPYGSLEAPALPYDGVPADTLALPIGQGHTAYGRYAQNRPANPAGILAPELDLLSGGIVWSLAGVTVEKKGTKLPPANTDGSLGQHGRGIAQTISFENYQRLKTAGHAPHLRLPLPEGYDAAQDFYPPHSHPEYRWGMVVDLDRCIGCEACVVACNAENNVAIVGRQRVLEGREMFWLRIERYFEPDNPGVRFIPMLCQHCDNAPCEPVCPVYAPHHGAEGLNNQIYNRCIGTRFCSQNCPYKVRRFNWFTFTRPEPLHWQLNPDVTVREKGVMEKCSFCVQRIVEAKNRAKDQARRVRDGEITPACAQTCPTDALIFGNLKDPQSRVSKLLHDPRAYQVIEHVNTKPAVIYLKKVIRKIDFIIL